VNWRSSVGEVPFIPEKRIEQDAELLLVEYARDQGVAVSFPVPIEEVLEVQLKLTFEMDDLRAAFASPDVLGAIWFKNGLVKVDASLDPHTSPQMLGRFRFTLAHEVGHWRLHRHLYREDPSQAHLFGGHGHPAFVCRSSDKPSVEWQADNFASYALMPKKLVMAAWQEWQGNLDPVILSSLPPATGGGGRDPDNVRLDRFAKPLAEKLEVSAEAMRIRLEKLGLLLRETPNTLF